VVGGVCIAENHDVILYDVVVSELQVKAVCLHCGIHESGAYVAASDAAVICVIEEDSPRSAVVDLNVVNVGVAAVAHLYGANSYAGMILHEQPVVLLCIQTVDTDINTVGNYDARTARRPTVDDDCTCVPRGCRAVGSHIDPDGGASTSTRTHCQRLRIGL